MVGDCLFPLNRLKEKLPAVYDTEVRKYDGRTQLLQRQIPILNCLWNDVLHLAPIHPAQVRAALVKAGFERFPAKWLQISPDAVGMSDRNTVVYLYTPEKRGHFDAPLDDFVRFTPERLAELNALPEATAAYYAEMNAQGKRPLLFHLVPHILFKGCIYLQDTRIIEV